MKHILSVNEGKAYVTSSLGQSLFTKINRYRTCAVAGIDEHWCCCHSVDKLEKNSGEVNQAASHLLKHINYLLQNHTDCVQLVMNTVVQGSKRIEEKENSTIISVMIEVEPSGGLFEGTIKYKGFNSTPEISKDISRINLYGDQSKCVNDSTLKLYCYCK